MCIGAAASGMAWELKSRDRESYSFVRHFLQAVGFLLMAYAAIMLAMFYAG